MRTIIPLSIVLIVAACGTAIFWNRQNVTTTEWQRQCDEFRSLHEAHVQAIADLRNSIERLQLGIVGTTHATSSARTVNVEADLTIRLAELAVLQSNTLALVERLMARAASLAPPESLHQREAGITALESAAAEHQQKLDAIKQKVVDLLVTLNIPPEVSSMDAAKVFDNPSLRTYWPFFEAKRQRENMQFLLERLQARLMQEKLEAKVQAQKETAH